VQVKDHVHDLPFAIDLEQREQVGDAVAGPVVEFDAATAANLTSTSGNSWRGSWPP
jgi:hypothetical protein